MTTAGVLDSARLWIAAIATSQGLPVVTQDGDFDALAGVAGVEVIRV